MTKWYEEKNLLNLLLNAGQCHCATEQAVLEVHDQLYPVAHEVMHRHECRLLDSAKPANQLVSNVGEPHQCFKVVLDALEKVFVCLVVLSGTSCEYIIAPVSECNFLQALFQEREDGQSVLLFVCRKVIDHLMLEIW